MQGDEAMPDLEHFEAPDAPRPMTLVEVLDDSTVRVTRPEGSVSILGGMAPVLQQQQQQGTKNKRKNPDERMFRGMAVAEARRLHPRTVIRRKDGTLVQPANDRTSELITARTTAPGLSDAQREQAAEVARTELLNRVGITDGPDGDLRFPDPSSAADQIKLARQKGLAVWQKVEGLTPEGCFGFRDRAHRGLSADTRRVPISGDHFDRQLKEWAGNLRNILTTLPLIDVPIATPVFLGWLVDKHWPVVATSFDVFSCYTCALRMLVGGMDVGVKVIEPAIAAGRLFGPVANSDKDPSATGQPLWTVEQPDTRRREREKLRGLRYPDWFDLGLGNNPTGRRSDEVSDDSLEKIMVQRAVENQMAVRGFVLARMNAGIVALQSGLETIRKANGVVPMPTLKQFFDRLYSLCEVTTYRLLSAYELTILWAVQRHVPHELLGGFSRANRRVSPADLPAPFVRYIHTCRRSLFQTRSFMGGSVPPPRPGPGENGFDRAIIRPSDPSFPTVQEMNAFYAFLQTETKGKQDLIDRLTRLNVATNGPAEAQGH